MDQTIEYAIFLNNCIVQLQNLGESVGKPDLHRSKIEGLEDELKLVCERIWSKSPMNR